MIQKSNGQAVFILCLKHTRLLELIGFFYTPENETLAVILYMTCLLDQVSFVLHCVKLKMYVSVGHYSQAIMSIQGRQMGIGSTSNDTHCIFW